MDLYREIILDHYKNPRNFGHLDHADSIVSDANVSCGDRIIMEISIEKKGTGIYISDIRFSGQGCAISQASASMLTEKVQGMSVEAVKKLNVNDILEMLGTSLTPSRIKCGVLPLEVLQKALTATSQK